MTTHDSMKIRDLNDRFPRSLSGTGKRLMTAGVVALTFAHEAATREFIQNNAVTAANLVVSVRF